jgi:hypothetical protein
MLNAECCSARAVVGSLAIFYTATVGKDGDVDVGGLLSKIVGADIAANVPAEAVALGAFAACGALSLPIVLLVTADDAAGGKAGGAGQERKGSHPSGNASAPSSPRRSPSPAVSTTTVTASDAQGATESARLRRAPTDASS